MTINDLTNEIKLYEHFIVQGNQSIPVVNIVPDKYREMVRLGKARGWLKHVFHWQSGAQHLTGYELTHSGKAWFAKRKEQLAD